MQQRNRTSSALPVHKRDLLTLDPRLTGLVQPPLHQLTGRPVERKMKSHRDRRSRRIAALALARKHRRSRASADQTLRHNRAPAQE